MFKAPPSDLIESLLMEDADISNTNTSAITDNPKDNKSKPSAVVRMNNFMKSMDKQKN